MKDAKLIKAIVHVGIRSTNKDPKFLEVVEKDLTRITGQKPIRTLAKKSIAGFKTRKGMVVGVKVTLRGKRMKDMVTKVVEVALPRTRDFWGLPLESIDRNGNLSLGFVEHLAFPEIRSDEVEQLHGVEVTMVSDAKNVEEAEKLYRSLGFIFKKD